MYCILYKMGGGVTTFLVFSWGGGGHVSFVAARGEDHVDVEREVV